MKRIDFEIDDFMNNCDYKNLSGFLIMRQELQQET